MKLNEPLGGNGFFWSPDKPEKKLPGTLSIEESGDIRLAIWSHHDYAAGVLVLDKEHLPLGVGAMHADGGRDWKQLSGQINLDKMVALDDCRWTGGSHSLGSTMMPTRSTYRVERCLIGAAYSEDGDEKEIHAERSYASFEGLIGWLSHVVAWERNSELGDPRLRLSVEVPQVERVDVQFDDDWKIGVLPVYTGPERRGDDHQLSVGQTAVVVVDSAKQAPLREFQKRVRVFQDLLCFALDARCCMTSLQVDTGERDVPRLDVVYRDGLLPKPSQAPRRPASMYALFCADDEAIDSIADVVREWFRLYERVPTVLDRLRASAAAEDHLENLVLLVVQALEAMHREFGTHQTVMGESEFVELKSRTMDVVPEKFREWWDQRIDVYLTHAPLRKRLQEFSLRYLSESLGKKEARKLAYGLASARNPVSHGRAESGLDASSLAVVWKQGEALLKLVVLDHLGVDWRKVLERNRGLRHSLGLEGWDSVRRKKSSE